jgi:hypothetical protein
VPTSEAKTYEEKIRNCMGFLNFDLNLNSFCFSCLSNETFVILTTISIDYLRVSHFVVQGTADHRESVCVAVQNG